MWAIFINNGTGHVFSEELNDSEQLSKYMRSGYSGRKAETDNVEKEVCEYKDYFNNIPSE